MNVERMKATMTATAQGKLSFPEVVGRLLEEGVESYRVDFQRMEETFYAIDGQTHTEKMAFALMPIAQDFDVQAVQAAIGDSQAGIQAFPEFATRVMQAGTAGYIAYLHGQRVLYLGRNGGYHMEYFPGTHP